MSRQLNLFTENLPTQTNCSAHSGKITMWGYDQAAWWSFILKCRDVFKMVSPLTVCSFRQFKGEAV